MIFYTHLVMENSHKANVPANAFIKHQKRICSHGKKDNILAKARILLTDARKLIEKIENMA